MTWYYCDKCLYRCVSDVNLGGQHHDGCSHNGKFTTDEAVAKAVAIEHRSDWVNH